jgi:hypothetical protein
MAFAHKDHWIGGHGRLGGWTQSSVGQTYQLGKTKVSHSAAGPELVDPTAESVSGKTYGSGMTAEVVGVWRDVLALIDLSCIRIDPFVC